MKKDQKKKKKKKKTIFGSPLRSSLENAYLQSPMGTRQICRDRTNTPQQRRMSLIDPLPPVFVFDEVSE